MTSRIEEITKEVGALPLWAQITGLILTGLATFAALWAIYLVYNPPIPQNIFAEAANTTSTIPLGDILSRVNDFKTGYEESNFLKSYSGKHVSGQGSYENFFGEGNYYAVVSFRVGWYGWLRPYQIACALKETDQDEKETLMLLKRGQRVYFVGTFRNSNLNGLYYPLIDGCSLLKTST